MDKQENTEFYECGSINKLIDSQYNGTRKTYKRLLVIYLVGFVLPAVTAACLCDDQTDDAQQEWRKYLSMIALVVSVGVWSLELVEIAYHGCNRKAFKRDYLSGYNLTDFFEPLVYGAHVALWFGWCHRAAPEMEIVYALVTFAVFGCAVGRILQYVGFDDDFAFSVRMLTDVSRGLGSFLVLFGLMVVFFSLIQ